MRMDCEQKSIVKDATSSTYNTAYLSTNPFTSSLEGVLGKVDLFVSVKQARLEFKKLPAFFFLSLYI